eukprot:3575262-Amphidinium_carterae.1
MSDMCANICLLVCQCCRKMKLPLAPPVRCGLLMSVTLETQSTHLEGCQALQVDGCVGTALDFIASAAHFLRVLT